MKLQFIALFLIPLALACGSDPTPAPEMRTPTPEPTPIVFPTPLPTPTPAPTPDLGVIFQMQGDLEYLKQQFERSPWLSEANGGEAATKNEGDSYESDSQEGLLVSDVPSPTMAPEPKTPTPRPTPTATPPVGFYVSAPPVLAEQYRTLLEKASVNLTWAGDEIRTVAISGIFTNKPDIQPTMVQIWQALNDDESPECNTERPVAFIIPGDNAVKLGTTKHRWQFCNDSNTPPQTYTSDVPWFYAGGWTHKERKRHYITEPRIWDFSMSADFRSRESLDLEYANPSGWRVVVFSGDTIIGYFWIPF